MGKKAWLFLGNESAGEAAAIMSTLVMSCKRLSMDGEPILGPVEKFPGLHMAVAFHSGGFAYNPVAGFLMAQYVMDGRTSIDVSTFSPNRFDPLAVDAHLATTVAQKNALRRRH